MTKRFFRQASAIDTDGGYAVALDAKPIRTPLKNALVLPTLDLATAIAAEWNAQTDRIDQATMSHMRLACTAIDDVAANLDRVCDSLAGYAAMELLCYRADAPEALVQRQTRDWQPLLDWATARYGVTFEVTQGVVPVDQPRETVAGLRASVRTIDPFRLAGLQALAMDLGSLVLALAVFEAHVPGARAFALSQLDELYQAEIWGADEEAETRRSHILADVEADEAFLQCLGARNGAS